MVTWKHTNTADGGNLAPPSTPIVVTALLWDNDWCRIFVVLLRLGLNAISGFAGVALGFEVLSIVGNTCVSAGVLLISML